MSNYLPTADGPFNNFFLNFKNLIAATPTNYGLAASDGTALTASYTAWNTAYQAAINPTTRTKGTVAAKNTQKDLSTALVRTYAATIRVNHAVSDLLKIGLGLHIADTSPTPVPPPTTKPMLAITAFDQGVQEVRATDESTPTSRARAVGSAGMLLYRAIGAAPVNDPSQATFIAFVGRPQFRNHFTNADTGKVATYFARWTNAKGEVGPWSQAVSGSIAA